MKCFLSTLAALLQVSSCAAFCLMDNHHGQMRQTTSSVNAKLAFTPKMSWVDEGLQEAGRKIGAAVLATGLALAAPTALHSSIDVAHAENTFILEQLKQLQTEQQSARLENVPDGFTNPESIIAKGVVTIPSSLYPLGLEDATTLPGLDNKDAALILATYGKSGPPVAAIKIKLANLKFPLKFEITDNDLLYPLTPSAWAKDDRQKDNLGVVALIDTDGVLATADGKDYVGSANSNLVNIAGSQLRGDATIKVKARGNDFSYSDSDLITLERIDDQLVDKEISVTMEKAGSAFVLKSVKK